MLFSTLEAYDEAISDAENMLTDIVKEGIDVDISASDTAVKRRRPGLTTTENYLRRLRRERNILANQLPDGIIEGMPGW